MDYDLYSDRQIVDGILSNDKQLIGYFFNKISRIENITEINCTTFAAVRECIFAQ